MRKKTNKVIFAILGFLAIAFALLGILSISEFRKETLEGGNAVAAKYWLTDSVLLLGVAFLGAVFIILLLRRDKKIQLLQAALLAELEKSPAFKTWLLKEEAQIKKQYGLSRRIGVVFSVLIAMMMFFYFLLVVEFGLSGVLTGVSFLLGIGGIVFLLRFSDYIGNYIDPMLESVSLILPSPSAKEAFANQMKGKERRHFVYSKASGFYQSTAFLMPDYCYFRQYRSSCVIINAPIRRIVVKRAGYFKNTLGYVPLFRSCYAMELYLDSDSLKEPVWQGCFYKQEAVHQALSLMQSVSFPEAEIEDQIKQG